MSPDPRASSCVLGQPLAGIGNRPPELHEGHINIDTASVCTAAAIDADIRPPSCTTVAFAAVEDNAHVTQVGKLSTQLFISVQPGPGDDEGEHVSNPAVSRLPLTRGGDRSPGLRWRGWSRWRPSRWACRLRARRRGRGLATQPAFKVLT